MASTNRDTSSGTDRIDAAFDLGVLKKNPQLQQLLLMTLSAIKQQQNDTTATLDNDKRKFDQLDARPLSADIAALSDHGSPGSDSSSEKMLGRPGRKPLSEEEIKQSEMDPKSKRKAQNRAAQRAFRERRVNHVKELEDRIKELEENQDEATDKIMDENRQLKKIIQQLQMENAILGGSASSFDIPLSKQLCTTADDNINSLLIPSSERPQKLLRSIGDNHSNATLLSATTPHHQELLYDSSSSPPSLLSNINSNQSITSSDTYNDDGLSGTSLPTDILNTFDAVSQLTQSFGLDANSIDPELFNALTTTNTLASISTKPSSSTSRTPSNKADNNDTTSNEWMESLLVVDEDDTDSSSSLAATATTVATSNEHDHKYSTGDNEHQPLPQVWDKLTEHPRFDEFDLDFLCDEMKRKAVCNDGTPCDNKSHQEYIQETIRQYYQDHPFVSIDRI